MTKMETRVFGKWILVGEHAVLRGSPALVFPVLAKSLVFKYEENHQPLTAEFIGESGGELRLLFWGVIEKALEMVGVARANATGHIVIESSIPVGAGLGASAALCVAVGRWLAWEGWVQESALYEFARQLENLFHGESSGVDIAVALSGKGLRFERAGARSELAPAWQPRWYISYSGKRGVTSECVSKVKNLWEIDRPLAEKIDRDMREAVHLAERALASKDEAEGTEFLARSIRLARTCFDRWGLSSGETAEHLSLLEREGALAVKPTGSGDGGFALSLWAAPPPLPLAKILIPLSHSNSNM